MWQRNKFQGADPLRTRLQCLMLSGVIQWAQCLPTMCTVQPQTNNSSMEGTGFLEGCEREGRGSGREGGKGEGPVAAAVRGILGQGSACVHVARQDSLECALNTPLLSYKYTTASAGSNSFYVRGRPCSIQEISTASVSTMTWESLNTHQYAIQQLHVIPPAGTL